MSWVRIGLLVAALGSLALCGCTAAKSPELVKCKADASGDNELHAEIAACSAAIKNGLRGVDLADAFGERGEAYRRLGDPAHALSDLNAALRINPRDSDVLNDRGLAYLDQKQADPALADLSQAILVNPANGLAFENRGYVENYLDQYDKAIADESRAIELRPQSSTPWIDRGYAYAGKHRWDSAIADFNDALRREKDDEFALQGRAEAERGKGDAAAAIRDFDQVLSDDPHGDNALADAEAMVALSPAGDPSALNARCWVRGVQNTELDAALTDCQQSLATRPSSAETLDSLAFVYFRQGRLNEAITEYSAALDIDAKQSSSRFMRGVAELRTGDQVRGQADIDAAESADKAIADRFAGYGVKP